MGLPFYQWCFLSYVRIFDSGEERNNTVRAEWGQSESGLITVPAGLYLFGLGHSLHAPDNVWGYGASVTDDSDVFGATTFLEAFNYAIETLNESNPGGLILQTGKTTLPGGAAATGKILGSVQVEPLTLKWAHSETTMDPAWFGVAKGNAYPDTVLTVDPTVTTVGNMASTLALVGAKVLKSEPQEESYDEVIVIAGDGTPSVKSFGDGVNEISEFVVNAEGLQSELDNGFQSLRRWSQYLRFNRARRRFVYIPDLGTPDPSSDYPRQWDPNNSLENRRWGWRDLFVSRSYAFAELRRFGGSNRHWQLSLPVRRMR